MKKPCKWCGKEFEATKNKQYCCEECRKAGRNQSQRRRYHTPKPVVCAQCGKTFTPHTKQHKDRLLCYDCLPEDIDTSKDVLLIELPAKLHRQVFNKKKKERRFNKVKKLERQMYGHGYLVDPKPTTSDKDSKTKI